MHSNKRTEAFINKTVNLKGRAVSIGEAVEANKENINKDRLASVIRTLGDDADREILARNGYIQEQQEYIDKLEEAIHQLRDELNQAQDALKSGR